MADPTAIASYAKQFKATVGGSEETYALDPASGNIYVVGDPNPSPRANINEVNPFGVHAQILSAYNTAYNNAPASTYDYSLSPTQNGGVTNSGVTAVSPPQINTSANVSTTTPNAPTQYDTALADLLNNSNLSSDQRSLVQSIYNTIATNDQANANRLIAGFNAATEFSSPYFRAQVAVATDALTRSLSANEGDLAFRERQLQNTLSDLTANTAASRDMLSFQHTQELNDLARSYEQDLANTRDNMASIGKTSSSVRSRAEQILADQNTGLVESSNRQFGYQTGNLDRQLASGQRDTGLNMAYLTDRATQDRIASLRATESAIGSQGLTSLGYSGGDVLGGQGGSIPRQQVTDALSFSNSFVF